MGLSFLLHCRLKKHVGMVGLVGLSGIIQCSLRLIVNLGLGDCVGSSWVKLGSSWVLPLDLSIRSIEGSN